ncbi:MULTISPECIES: GyrI-like domain-containing protein [unclassified Streptomyces]|uniref:GyrI-like domain-containing protein n=1 Tax=unclassified Streptomyces TaxID=2593676 RepID=UPI003410BDE1
MEQQPTVEQRPEQTYVAVRRSVRMDAFGVIADRLPEIFGWLASHGTTPAGPPFFRFYTVDMQGESEVEAGVPVDSPPAPEGDIVIGTLPAGRYARLTHAGHPDRLFGAITRLREWAAEQGLEWDLITDPDGVERWGCRVESYLTDPRVEPDMNKWETELAFRLADQ